MTKISNKIDIGVDNSPWMKRPGEPPSESESESEFTFANAEAAAVVAAMTTPPTDTRKALIDALVGELKTAGVWAKLDCLYIMAAHDEQAGRLNWIDSATFTLVPAATDAPFFTADFAFYGDTTTGVNSRRFDSGWNPSVNAIKTSSSSHCMFAKIAAAVAGDPSNSRAVVGCQRDNMGGSHSSITPSRSGPTTGAASAYALAPANAGVVIASGQTAPGFWLANRVAGSGIASLKLFKNGTLIGQVASNTTSPNHTYAVCGHNIVNGSFSSNYSSTHPLSAAGWGASLSDTEVSDLDTALNNYISGL